MRTVELIKREVEIALPTEVGQFRMTAFTENATGQEHLALTMGEWTEDEPVLVRVHSSCVTGDIFGSCRCDCGPQLETAMRKIEEEGKGAIIYLFQEGRGIGLVNKLKAYQLQEEGYDTVEANEMLGFAPDLRNYQIGAQMIQNLGIKKLKLMSNNPAKTEGLTQYGLEIHENISLEIHPNQFNDFYLKTKKTRMRHKLKIA